MSTPTATPFGGHSHPRVMVTSLGTPSLKRGANLVLTDTEDNVAQTAKKARPKAGDVTDSMHRSLLLLACAKFRCLISTRTSFVDSTTELDDLVASAWFMACDKKGLPDNVLPSDNDLKVIKACMPQIRGKVKAASKDTVRNNYGFIINDGTSETVEVNRQLYAQLINRGAFTWTALEKNRRYETQQFNFQEAVMERMRDMDSTLQTIWQLVRIFVDSDSQSVKV
ncbi:hypothetical protein PHLCEN_2v4310 [Hermanssonia centrifuga]|uniref:DUF6532 domain-containing protein n=1 Tax=Hermanssonia centrifuga TaxID=98765 RepID=A0A2R6PVL8_9APHY|nr:hypothetical protein PHLCEN_2v4310 [Hermanssonia centrifuga]